MTTRIRMQVLSRIFPQNENRLPIYVARLSVLYEDLRIELHAIAEKSIPALDQTDEKYRRHYFLRRCIATLVEFAEALRLIDQCPEFGSTRAEFDAPLLKYWRNAIRFFAKHEIALERVRNDIGGHFGHQAATYAITSHDLDTVGKIEVRSDKSIHLHFAGEIAAAATMRHLRGPTAEIKFTRLLRTVVLGFRHATRAVHCLSVTYLWQRFGR